MLDFSLFAVITISNELSCPPNTVCLDRFIQVKCAIQHGFFVLLNPGIESLMHVIIYVKAELLLAGWKIKIGAIYSRVADCKVGCVG